MHDKAHNKVQPLNKGRQYIPEWATGNPTGILVGFENVWRDSVKPSLMTLTMALLLAVSALSGCGQKGPLFLPEKAPTEQQP